MKYCLSNFQVELIPYLSILVMNIIIMMKLSASNQFRRSFYQSGRQNSNNTEEMELQEVLPEQKVEIQEDSNSNQGLSHPLKSCIPCCCKPSQVENISRYVGQKIISFKKWENPKSGTFRLFLITKSKVLQGTSPLKARTYSFLLQNISSFWYWDQIFREGNTNLKNILQFFLMLLSNFK